MTGWSVTITAGAEFYVSPDGNNANPGTLSAPFSTINKAASIMNPGDTCWLRKGTYRETVIPANSGTDEAPITFRSYPGETAVISGADIITGDWTLDGNSTNIWKTSMPWTLNGWPQWWSNAGGDQVFVDSQMMPEARWPDIGCNPAVVGRDQMARAQTGEMLNVGSEANNTPAVARYTLSGLPGTGDAIKDAHIYFVAGCLWAPMTGTVLSSSDGNAIFSFTAPNPLKVWDNNGYVYYCRQLDTFYVWGKRSLLDSPGEWFRGAGGILYLQTPASDNPASHLVEAKKRYFAFDLKGRAYISLINLDIFAAGIDSDISSHHLVIDRLKARYISHATWFPWWWADPTQETGGVWLYGDNSKITNSTIDYSAASGIVVKGSNCKVINNIIRDVGYSGYGANISLGGTQDGSPRSNAEGLTVSHNTIRGTGLYQCIDFWSLRDSQIAYNNISESGKLLTDDGLIFGGSMWSVEIMYNLLHDTRGLGPNDGWEHYYGNSGIYLAETQSDVNIHHNVVWNTSQMGLITWTDPTGPLNFVNNTILDVPQGISMLGGGSRSKVSAVNNICKGANFNGTELLVTNNFVYGSTDPCFANADANDFTLAFDSPAVNAGAVFAPYTDEYVSPAPDIGAFEYGNPVWQAGAIVNFSDLADFCDQWPGQQPGLSADLNGNGTVDFVDFNIFAGFWMSPCPADWSL